MVSRRSRKLQMEHALHALCQPLTTLQCRLEFAQMMGDDAAFRRAVEGSLLDCTEIGERITAMRGALELTTRQYGKTGQ